MIEFFKKHYLWIAGAIVLLGVYYIYSGSGKSAATTATGASDPNAQDVQAAAALQIEQLRGQQAALQTNAQADVANHQINGQVTVAQMNGQNSVSIATLQASVQQNSDTLSAQTTQAVSGLQAQVAIDQSNNQLLAEMAAIQGEVDIASLPYTSVTPALIAQVNNLAAQQTSINGAVSGIVGAINSTDTNLNNLANSTGYYLPNAAARAPGGANNNNLNIYSYQGAVPVTGATYAGNTFSTATATPI